jgi:UDP-N-acetylmuramoyl-tripeptide--D-alanyl-D-alanine ligase
MDFERYYETSGICTDTRNITKNSLFICLKGANFNGNEFADQALIEGAKFVISDDKKHLGKENIFVVENCLEYLQKLANYHRKKFTIPIIGITGTNGKTTTKELISTVLAKKYNTLFTIGNLNNHIGVPLTLLRLNKYHQIAVIEMGANKPGDIKELVEIAEPTHGIITNMGKAHLEGFGSFEGVQKTKSEMYDFLIKNNAPTFYNEDDEILKINLKNRFQNSISYSSSKSESYIKGELISMSPFVKMKWSCKEYTSNVIETKMIGEYNYNNFLAAICIGKYFSVENDLINEAISTYQPSNNRSQVEKTNNNTIILDAYNANPTSMKNAIESFNNMNVKNKLLILGDMFELGIDSDTEHQNVIALTDHLNLDAIFVGANFHKIKGNNSSLFFKDKEELKEYLTTNKIENNFILLKASRGIGLETIKELL